MAKEIAPADLADKDMRKVAKALVEQGFTLTRSSKGHVIVHKDGKLVTTFSGTASDHRSYRNALAAARRAGFVWRR
ncbi:Uncharacterised protein [Mycobacteroides abscessus subsp. abscessus]|nr:Uncharacterised protein [Mycobacteroides abscessus subsp. abscessus]